MIAYCTSPNLSALLLPFGDLFGVAHFGRTPLRQAPFSSHDVWRPLVRKWKKALILVVAVVLLGFVLNGVHMRYLLVTNPDDPRFDPRQFRFSNYSKPRGNEPEFKKAITKMFPPGTDKAYVDKILVDRAGARVDKNQNSRFHNPTDQDYTYVWSPSGLGGWLVNFIFDEHNKSRMMRMGITPIYGINPKAKWREDINSGRNAYDRK
jgi:hypothetical protein